MALKHLQDFLFAPNYYAKRKDEKVYNPRALTPQDRAELLERVNIALLPENLTCKFMLTGETLRLKTEMLEGAKRQLEKK
jgi:hypothetical protein